jgi:hypothetical protein
MFCFSLSLKAGVCRISNEHLPTFHQVAYLCEGGGVDVNSLVANIDLRQALIPQRRYHHGRNTGKGRGNAGAKCMIVGWIAHGSRRSFDFEMLLRSEPIALWCLVEPFRYENRVRSRTILDMGISMTGRKRVPEGRGTR